MAYKTLDDAAQKLRVFSAADLRQRFPAISAKTISEYLYGRTKRGILKKLGRGQYEFIELDRIPKRLPSGFVANLVWQVLAEAEGPLDLPAIISRADSKLVDARQLYLVQSINATISRWHSLGQLCRTGRRRRYEYKLKYQSAERPASSRIH